MAQDRPEADASTQALQFDKADFGRLAPIKTCAACGQGIATEYFEIAGRAICPLCRDRFTGNLPDKLCFWRAAVYGGIAAIIGTIVWSLIIHFTGYEIGLIAIIVGVGVGKAVRKGSRGRGGWKYQSLAIILTYVSITTSYVPIVAKGFVQGAKNREVQAAASSDTASAANKTAAPSTTAAGAGAGDTKSRSRLPVPLAVLAFVALVWGFALIAPFLAGASNIMGIIIIGVGLYEAWRFNRRVPVTGPFRLALSTPAAAAPPGSP